MINFGVFTRYDDGITMYTFSSERGGPRAGSLASRRAWWAGLGLVAASLTVAVAGQQRPAGPRLRRHNRRLVNR